MTNRWKRTGNISKEEINAHHRKSTLQGIDELYDMTDTIIDYLRSTHRSQLTPKQQKAIIDAYYRFRAEVGTELYDADKLHEVYRNYEECRNKVSRFLSARIRSNKIKIQEQVDIIKQSQQSLLAILEAFCPPLP